jgi:molybdate transport system substrate-binding protein
MGNVIRVPSTLALMGAVRSVAGRYQAAGGARIDADFAPTLGLLDRLRGGEDADVVILTREGLDHLAGRGKVVAETCVDLARSFVGIAVRAGVDHPDIATEQALRATLLGAQVAYSRIGASGIFFAELIERLGIALYRQLCLAGDEQFSGKSRRPKPATRAASPTSRRSGVAGS